MRFLDEISTKEMDYILALHELEPLIPLDRDDLRSKAMTAFQLNAQGVDVRSDDLIYLPSELQEGETEATEETTAISMISASGAIPVRRV